jgi:hypothetical protein
MDFTRKPELEGQHAFLSPSNYHWINYSYEKLEERYNTAMAARRGTELHEFAHQAAKLGIKLPKSEKTLNMYVNDIISYKMSCEVPLYYSPNCFGHADAISFRNNKLRISDLKTGVTKASHTQLEVYSALFCLQYMIEPHDIFIELRIYQNDEISYHEPNPEHISHIMEKIVDFDLKIESFKVGGFW